MARKKKPEEPEPHENAERWLLTYADLITLLVAFFIMMYSMSALNIQKFQQLAISIRSGFGGDFGMKGSSIVDKGWPTSYKDEPITGSDTEGKNKIKPLDRSVKPPEGANQQTIFDYVKSQVATLKLEKSYIPLLDLDSTEGNRARVILSDRIYFKPGETNILEETRREIIRTGKIVKDSTFKVAIDGYSSEMPDNFGDGWSVSLERARQVALIMVTELKINPRRLTISGYGEWKDPGRTRKLKMTEQGGWEKVEEGKRVIISARDLVVISLIVK